MKQKKPNLNDAMQMLHSIYYRMRDTFDPCCSKCHTIITTCECERQPKPPAYEGVREALEAKVREILSPMATSFIKENIKTNFPLADKIVDEIVALAALPELEKRDCPVKDWTEQKLQHPKDCRDCNGHGEVWVRKAGV